MRAKPGTVDRRFPDEAAARVYAVTPTKVLAFGKDPFSQTTFRF